MYATKPLSTLRRSPELLDSRPKDGPNSGYLVIFDEECETTTCFGLCKSVWINDLPFPQNKDLTTSYSTGVGDQRRTYHDEVVFVPVINEPLSSNRYYVINRQGKHKGEAIVCSTEDDVKPYCCWGTYIDDVKPRPLDPSDIYQQVEIIQKNHGGFTAKSIAQDGFPPSFLRRNYWHLSMKTPRHYQLEEAPGLNSTLRAALPSLDFSSARARSDAVVVGKWYVPFAFVTDPGFSKLGEQMKGSMFYEMTLEQRWERVFERDSDGGTVVHVDTAVFREEAFVGGKAAVCEWGGGADEGVLWFRDGREGKSRFLGLSGLVAERMRFEQERAGFEFGDPVAAEREVNVKRTEAFEGQGEWSKFGCYVLVERFVLKRVGGSVVLTHDFKHTQQVRSKWE